MGSGVLFPTCTPNLLSFYISFVYSQPLAIS